MNHDMLHKTEQAKATLMNMIGLDHTAGNSESDDLAGPKKLGMLLFLVVFGVFGGWATLAPIEGAAHAPGIVSVKSYKKLVEHFEGGIVSEIRVDDGDQVNAGDTLIVLDSTQALAQLRSAQSRYTALLAREARLKAERDSLESVVYPQTLLDDAEAAIEIDSQNQIFVTSKKSRDGSREVLEQRISQLQSRIRGLKSQQVSKQAIADSWAEEIADIKTLLDRGFADNQHIRELERNHVSLLGEVAELETTISEAEIQTGETRLQVLQLDKDFQNEIVSILGDMQTELADLRQRIFALEDVVRRTEIKAPVDGVATGLQVHTIGAVIEPGTPVLDIVPQSEELVIEARVSPLDIDRVAMNQDVSIRFPSFSGRTTPVLDGRVFTISADSQVDQVTGASYYEARIEIIPESLKYLESQILVQGMPADAFISTGSRTLLQYLFKPLSDGLARSLIED